MDYFLSIENSQYYHWQAELLIESFKANACEDKLFMYVFSNNIPTSYNKNFFDNITYHKRKEYLSNIGEQKGCVELNKIYSIVNSLATQRINQPFFVLEPDTVLRKEIFNREEDGFYSSFIFYVDPLFTIEEAEKNVGPFCEWLELDRDTFESGWLPIAESYMFNKIPIELFFSMMQDAEKMAVYQILEKGKVWGRTCDLAVAINIIKNISSILCRGDYQLSSPIDSGSDSYFVSYKDGYLPNFHKSMFKYGPPINLSFGDPISCLSELNFSPNSSYVAKIARSSIEKR